MRWLMLSLAVLLAHLGLLQALPWSAPPTSAPVPKALSTRWLPGGEPRALAPAPLQPAAVAPPARPVRAAHIPRPKPVSPPGPPAPPVALGAAAAAWSATAPASPSPADHSLAQTADSVSERTRLASVAQAGPPEPAASQQPTLVAEAPNPAPPGPQAAALLQPPLRFDSARLSPPTRLTYVLNSSKLPISLSAELLWQHQGASYQARLSYSAFGLSRAQTSRGRIGDQGLVPERFADKYRSELAAHFNYATGKVTFSANTPDAELQSGAQDRLSVLLQLGAWVASDPSKFSAGRTLTLQTVGPRSADLWLFGVIQTELLTLPGGRVNSLKLERLPREPYDQRVEVWLSPELAYLPARIRVTEANGDSVDQQWAASAPAEPAN